MGRERKIAVIGCGRAGMIHAGNFARRVGGAELAALADPVETALAAAKEELGPARASTDWKALVGDPSIDAIVVATPTVHHEAIVTAAARAGKHILCEKPMAMDAPECERMIEAVDRAGVVLQIGFMRRYDRSFLSAKSAIDLGKIGPVVSVKSLTHGPSIPKPWQYDIAASNGPLAEVNSHDIDTLRWFTGSEFAEVYAVAGNFRCPEAKASHPDFYDNVLMVARFANGMQGLVDGAVSVRYGYDARVEVLGTRGTLLVGELRADSSVVCTADGGMATSIVQSWRNLFAEAYLAEDVDFIACIREKRPPRARGVDGMMAVKVVNAGNQSIREGRPVKLS